MKIPTRVLIVDDEKDFVEMLAMRLNEAGEKVLTAHSGRQCLEVLAAQPEGTPVDVVILDIKMPEMDGMETLAQIRKHHPLVEVIMLTGHGTVETAVMGMKHGAFDYLLKPADFDDLAQKLEGARKRSDEQKERIRAAEAKAIMRKKRGMF